MKQESHMSVETYSSAKQKIEKEILRLQKQMKSLRVKQRRPVIASIVKSMQDNEITIEEVAEALENSARRGAGAGSNGPKTSLPPKYRHPGTQDTWTRSEEHTSELQSRENLVCRLLLEKKKKEIVYT